MIMIVAVAVPTMIVTVVSMIAVTVALADSPDKSHVSVKVFVFTANNLGLAIHVNLLVDDVDKIDELVQGRVGSKFVSEVDVATLVIFPHQHQVLALLTPVLLWCRFASGQQLVNYHTLDQLLDRHHAYVLLGRVRQQVLQMGLLGLQEFFFHLSVRRLEAELPVHQRVRDVLGPQEDHVPGVRHIVPDRVTETLDELQGVLTKDVAKIHLLNCDGFPPLPPVPSLH